MKSTISKTFLLSFFCLSLANLQSASLIIQKQPIPSHILLSTDIDPINIIQKVVEQGYDVNARYSCCEAHDYEHYGFAPLHMAVYYNKINVTEFLIFNGADINASNQIGQTPLMIAVIYRNIKLIELLLKNEAQLDLKDNFGNSALILSIGFFSIHKDIIKLLLEAGADYNQKNEQGQSFKSLIYKPLTSYWAEEGRKEVVKMFEEFVESKNKLNVESVH